MNFIKLLTLKIPLFLSPDLLKIVLALPIAMVGSNVYIIQKVSPITSNHITVFGSSRPEVVCKKLVLRNLVKLTEKHLCQILFRNKVILRKRLWHRCFPVNFAKFLTTPLIIEHLWWLLLSF